MEQNYKQEIINSINEIVANNHKNIQSTYFYPEFTKYLIKQNNQKITSIEYSSLTKTWSGFLIKDKNQEQINIKNVMNLGEYLSLKNYYDFYNQVYSENLLQIEPIYLKDIELEMVNIIKNNENIKNVFFLKYENAYITVSQNDIKNSRIINCVGKYLITTDIKRLNNILYLLEDKDIFIKSEYILNNSILDISTEDILALFPNINGIVRNNTKYLDLMKLIINNIAEFNSLIIRSIDLEKLKTKNKETLLKHQNILMRQLKIDTVLYCFNDVIKILERWNFKVDVIGESLNEISSDGKRIYANLDLKEFLNLITNIFGYSWSLYQNKIKFEAL